MRMAMGYFPDDAVVMVAGPGVMVLAELVTKTDRCLPKAQVNTQVSVRPQLLWSLLLRAHTHKLVANDH